MPANEIFTADNELIETVLHGYGICEPIAEISELLRYVFSETEIRLILKVSFASRNPVVIKFKNESDINADVIEKQSAYAELLAGNGIPVARPFQDHGKYVTRISACGYEVYVTVEEFRDGEIQSVDLSTAYRTGELLAKTHDIAEKNDCHVDFPVLFDPFESNDLFFVKEFEEMGAKLEDEDRECFDRIMERYHEHMECLLPLQTMEKYAVQGDISNNNLFVTNDGEIGLFDFNRCGDNNLFCDAIMQAVFEARLMDYPEENEPTEFELLENFLRGYQSIRPFRADEIERIPHLYAVISAFWGIDLIYDEEESLMKLLEKNDKLAVSKKLADIKSKICFNLNVEYLP